MVGLKADFYEDGLKNEVLHSEVIPSEREVRFYVEFGNGVEGELIMRYGLYHTDNRSCLRLPRGKNTLKIPVEDEIGTNGYQTLDIANSQVPDFFETQMKTKLRENEEVKREHNLREVEFYWE